MKMGKESNGAKGKAGNESIDFLPPGGWGRNQTVRKERHGRNRLIPLDQEDCEGIKRCEWKDIKWIGGFPSIRKIERESNGTEGMAGKEGMDSLQSGRLRGDQTVRNGRIWKEAGNAITRMTEGFFQLVESGEVRINREG